MEISTGISETRAWAVVGAPQSFVTRIRETGCDDLGQPAVRFRSPVGGEPLRDQLRRAAAGEDLLLGSYSLFGEPSPFREFGPIYVTAESGAARPRPENLFASDYFGKELILRKYDRRHWMVSARRVTKQDAPGFVDEWVSSDDTAFVDARFSEYGCFACRFVRSTERARPNEPRAR